MDNKEFVEFIKKYGDIRPVQEAFKEYPVEEEEHKGKLDKQKYRENKLLIKDEENKLNVDSIVKTDVVYKIESEEIVCKIGQVDNEKIEEYKESHYEILNNKRNSSEH